MHALLKLTVTMSLLAVFRYDSLFVSTKSPITPARKGTSRRIIIKSVLEYIYPFTHSLTYQDILQDWVVVEYNSDHPQISQSALRPAQYIFSLQP